MSSVVAALYVITGGCYFDLPDVDPWDKARDARLYAGPHPVVAHPPCERWGRFWHGSPMNPHQFAKGDDNGCFEAALASVRKWGGVLEHPEASHAWKAFGLAAPPISGAWVAADFDGGWTCSVEQGAYEHEARKRTWLYANGVELPSLRWGRAPGVFKVIGSEGFHTRAERQAWREAGCPNLARFGGRPVEHLSHAQRARTPIPFRDLLLGIARSAYALRGEAA